MQPNKATGKEASRSKDILEQVQGCFCLPLLTKEQMESRVGLSETELESITGISAWKALMSLVPA